MGSVGNGSGNTATLKALSDVESRIYAGFTETAVIMSADGEILVDKSNGLKDRVYFYADDERKMKDAIMTHNHPSSTTFSIPDVNVLVKGQLKEIRAVAKNGLVVYSLKRDDTSSNLKFKSDFENDYRNHINEYKNNVTDPQWDNRPLMSEQEEQVLANKLNDMVSEYSRKYLKENASKFGYVYTEQKRR